MSGLRATRDGEAEAFYIYVKEDHPKDAPVSTETSVPATVNLDYDADGNLVGVEVLLS